MNKAPKARTRRLAAGALFLTALAAAVATGVVSFRQRPDGHPLARTADRLREGRLYVVQSGGGLYVSREPRPLAELEALPRCRPSPDGGWNGVVWLHPDGEGVYRYFGDPTIAAQVQWTLGLEPSSGSQFWWANAPQPFTPAKGGQP